jgi:exodeoxyribonuclease V alpha subunit
MTEVVAVDAFDVRLARRAPGILAEFNAAGVLGVADVHVAQTLGRLGKETDEVVLLAIALTVRAVRLGSVCIDLGEVSATVSAEGVDSVELPDLPWPAPTEWYAACRASSLVADGIGGEASRPLRLIGELLYLDRYWRQEEVVRAELDLRATGAPPSFDDARFTAALGRLFPEPAPDYQRLAAAACASGLVTVIAGGPGTGKTTTVARLIALLMDSFDTVPRIALAAPTGKAAARLQEAVAHESESLRASGLADLPVLPASTLHRLLGWRPGSQSRFRHDRTNRLPYDVVIVDETSMVSLTMMSRLLEAVRPDARVVLVGDPDQLASVEAGAVLGDLAHRPARAGSDARLGALADALPDDLHPAADNAEVSADDIAADLRRDVVRLRKQYRFGGVIGELAAAIRVGDQEKVVSLLHGGSKEIEFIDIDAESPASSAAFDSLRTDVTSAGTALVTAARAGAVDHALAALDRHRVLCAHREGPFGVTRWSLEIEGWLAEAIDGFGTGGEWYVGRPLLVTGNDHELKLYNGDTGVIINGTNGPVAAFARGDGPVLFSPSRLSGVQTVHAMTVHRSQGSQYDRATVLLPPVDSPLLTRELFYTAATRAKEFVRIVGTEAAVRRAVDTAVVRASGLRRR